MALISCPDCNKQVSENAPACPGCGAPIAARRESAGSGVVQLSTVQETSKHLKTQILISALLFWGGIIGIFATQDESSKPIAGGLMTIGMVWYIVTRFRVWWHHK